LRPQRKAENGPDVPKMNRETGTRAGRKKHRASILRLTAEQEKEILTYYAEGDSLRQISVETGIPRVTLGRWISGPLSAKLGKIVQKRKRRAAPEHRNHPEPGEKELKETAEEPAAELVNDQVHQGRHVPGVAGIEEYRPDLRMGGIKTSLGIRSEGIPGVEIKTTWYGAPVCSRCIGEALPPGGDRRDLLFDADAAGIHRPVCPDCRREGEQLTGWPGPHGGEMKHAPGLGEKPNPVVHPFDLPPLVKTPPSPWSPRPSSGPGVRKYPRK
jgi:hypothetical protein